MRACRQQGLVLGLVASFAALPVGANRLTIEVWPDASPDHVISCSFALTDGWISLVKVKGFGMPAPVPMRWRASRVDVDAVSDSLQAFVGGELGSVDTYIARQPSAPFLTVTWMTRLDDRLATGLYIQSGISLPDPLSRSVVSLGVGRPCGLSAKVGG